MSHATTATADASAEGLRGTWPTHLSWAALMLYLAGRGAGRVSIDHALGLE